MIGSALLRPLRSSHPHSRTPSWHHLGKSHLSQTPLTICRESSVPLDVLSTSDIVVGAMLAIALAFTASFLQGQRSQNDFVLWEKDDLDGLNNNNPQEENVVFDAESWKEISRPDNYILYRRKLKEREKKRKENRSFQVEQAWVVLALLVLFVPIFSVEFFFALSRQVICGANPINQSDWGHFLCSPAMVESSTVKL